MQNAFGECYSCYKDHVFQHFVSDEASANNTFNSTKESKGLSQTQFITNDRLILFQPKFDLQLKVTYPLPSNTSHRAANPNGRSST